MLIMRSTLLLHHYAFNIEETVSDILIIVSNILIISIMVYYGSPR